MIIRGDLEILRDLVIKTAGADAQLGKMLTATSDTGKVSWRDLTILQATDRTSHTKGALVTDGTFKVLYIANSNGAPGDDLTDARWSLLGEGGGGGGGSIVDVPSLASLNYPGDSETIYVIEDIGALYRWNDALSPDPDFEYISGGIPEGIQSVVSVGGIEIYDSVPEGSDLRDFINQLIRPLMLPTKANNYVTLNGVTATTMEIGSSYITTLTSPYNKGLIHSKDTPRSPSIALTGGKVFSYYTGNDVNGDTGIVVTYIVAGTQTWSVSTTYDAGNINEYYYDSNGERSDIFDATPVGDNSRGSGTVGALSASITGKYKYFTYAGSHLTVPDTSLEIRNESTGGGFYPTSAFTITIPVKNRGVAFYIPKQSGTQKTIKVTNRESSGADVTGTFNSVGIEIAVEDARGAPVIYLQYKTDLGGIGYKKVIHYDVSLT